MEGYIKLHRKLLDSYQFSNPDYLKIWIWLLLKANYKTSIASIKVNSGYADIAIERGQLIFGRSSAAKELKLDESKIYRVLQKLKNDNSIDLKSNNKFTIVTICKYDDYNSLENQSEQPANSQRTASEQPVNTSKEDKKDNKVKNMFIAPSEKEVCLYFADNGYKHEVGVKAFKYYDQTNWVDSKGKKIISWKQKMISVWFKDENKIEVMQSKMVY
jgi:ribosomal protein L30E